ncbi:MULTISPECIES: helix-turn-helix domain-containing protein [Trueperella]|uniref:Helix-turn-helix domain-containing protein n=1 Tax=Trueperella pecoris TaxID=2733571 RepID=A0A7M1QTT1_9ACTO|nr:MULTISPECIES: helix-turn-helix domain-containing protein [Trueperella]MDF2420152.1 helix-turn-helix domain-containing protein [Trueperella pyogenes]QOQ38011.1 helix-turn-helix domain-containing protein [Trueperella pecoris]QOR45542.1 helix-turn-helix domain-containing protein [Trueperella pecoris]QTG75386.1 helix-turn-helix domain-containing protein [Trueperella pecoris]UVJ59909.1 helix-turn-helix domain-containing protein [Trueperella pyogenes]
MATELLTTRQVANLAKVSRQTVARWVADGKVAAVTLPGGQLRFAREDIEAMLTPTIATERSADEGESFPSQEGLF